MAGDMSTPDPRQADRAGESAAVGPADRPAERPAVGGAERPVNETAVDSAYRAVDRIWAFLRHPATAAILGLLLLALILAAYWLPQAPGQTHDDPAALQRWVNAESDRWGGMAGPILRGLGLFNVYTSPLFLLILCLCALVASVHLADAIRRALLPRDLGRLLRAPVDNGSAPLTSPDRIERSRSAWPAPPTETDAILREKLTAQIAPPDAFTARPAEGAAEVARERQLSTAQTWAWPLRVLLPIGVLTLLAVLWLNTVWGWSVQTSALAPGDQFEWPQRGVLVHYGSELNSASPETITVQVGSETVQMPASAGRASVAGKRVTISEDAPALWLSTNQPLLQQPGQIETRTQIGLAFSQPGSEQVVVLPGEGVGLRVIRTDAPDSGFLVELSSADAPRPLQRREITQTETLTIPLSSGEAALLMQPARALSVDVRRSPWQWLALPALLLALAGAAGYLVRPRFALVETEPWPIGRTAVTVQSNDRAVVDGLAPTVTNHESALPVTPPAAPEPMQKP